MYRTAEAAIITVADTGVGIPSRDLSEVTRPFYRVDRQDGGESRLGLGLAVASGIAELHGGSLQVASRERQGTIVTMRLSTADEAASSLARPMHH